MPAELKSGPFTVGEACAAGLTRESLRSASWRRLAVGLYSWRGAVEDPCLLLEAWKRLLPPGAIFAGDSAALLWRIGATGTNPIEVILQPKAAVRTRQGLHVRRCTVDAGEVAQVRGLRVTTLHRTLLDLSARLPFVEALIAGDLALRQRLTDRSAMRRYADSARGRPGAASLRLVAAEAAVAESPMETRLRWLLIQAGLRRPEVQADLRDVDGRFVGRADLYYPHARLAIEYDGFNHRERLVADDRRQNLILNAGFRLLRFTASDLARPETVVSQVRLALLQSPV